jgi:hypothetical protein
VAEKLEGEGKGLHFTLLNFVAPKTVKSQDRTKSYLIFYIEKAGVCLQASKLQTTSL